MMAAPHLLLALSGHGYGHLAQCAPVINALWTDMPGMQLSICTSLPRNIIATLLDKPFGWHAVELDPVLPMFNAWEVDATAAERVYRDFHADWNEGIQRDVDLLAIQDAFSYHRCNRCAKNKRTYQIEEGSHRDGFQRREDFCCHNSCDGVCRIMESIDEIKKQS